MTESITTELQLARDRAAAARSNLAAAELALAEARTAETAVVPSNFDASDVKGYRAARQRATKRAADCADEVEFLTDVVRRCDDAVRPLELAAALAAYAGALEARAAEVAKVPGVVEALAAAVAPAVAYVGQLTATHQAVNVAAAGVRSLGERVESRHGEDEQLAGLAIRLRAQLQGDLAEQLEGLAELTRYVAAAPARAAAKVAAEREREHERAETWKQNALRGDLGPEERARAEKLVREQLIAFHGPRASAHLPSLLPEERYAQVRDGGKA